jgi:hypothetical protein
VLFRLLFFSAVDVLAALYPGKELIDKRPVGPGSRRGRFGEEKILLCRSSGPWALRRLNCTDAVALNVL